MSPGEVPPLDEGRIFEVFARHGDYVLVGGLGARLHGATRFTSDFDACPGWDRETSPASPPPSTSWGRGCGT